MTDRNPQKGREAKEAKGALEGKERPEGEELDGLLESLTADEGYREELETIPVDVGTLPTKTATPAAAPRPDVATAKPRMPLPGPKVPRRAPSDVRTAEPPAVNPAGPARKEPFPPAMSPSPGQAGRRPPAPSTRPAAAAAVARPAPRGQGGPPVGFDDMDIDRALSPLSEPPPPPETRRSDADADPTAHERPTTAPPAPKGAATPLVPPPVARGPGSMPPPDSWNPPVLETESLEELAAVEVEADDVPGASATSQAIRPSADPETDEVDALLGLSSVPPPASAPGVQSSVATFEEWEDDSVTTIRADADAVISLDEAPESLSAFGLTDADMASDPGVSPQPGPVAVVRTPPPPAPRDFSGERPAAEHLGDHRLIDAWVARAEWFEAEAVPMKEPLGKARLLLAASELWAMAGRLPRARDAARKASQAAPSLALASRQVRWLMALEGDWKSVATALDVEGRSAHDEAARAHASYLAAEIHRVALGDRANAERRMDLLTRASAGDPRPALLRLATELASEPSPGPGPGKGAAAPAPGRKRATDDPPSALPFVEAAAELAKLRSAADSPLGDHPPTPVAALAAARAALGKGDRPRAGVALGHLKDVPEIGEGALLLAASLHAPSRETRHQAIQSLREAQSRTPGTPIRRALAARALEQGDGAAMTLALTEGDGDTGNGAAPAFGPADRIALSALSGGDVSLLRAAAEEIGDDAPLRPLAVAAARASGAEGGVTVGSPEGQALLTLGRKLALARVADELKDAVHAVRAAVPTSAVGRLLSLELDRAAGATSAVAAELTRLAPEDQQAEGKLAAALIEEASGRPDVARRHYTGALGAPRTAEAAGRALVSPGDPSAQDLLSTLAAALGEETTARQALLLFEAVVRGAPDDTSTSDATEDLLERAHAACPEVPFAARLSTDLARKRGDAPKLLTWIRRQREAARDPVALALALVREALLAADDEPALALSLVRKAIEIRPEDVALRDLEARLDPTPTRERAAFRERAASATAEPRSRAFLLYESATEYAKIGADEDRARVAAELTLTDPSPLSQLTAERLTRGQLEEPPRTGLARLQALEAELLSAEQESELALEAVASELAQLPDRAEAVAHAHLAARLRRKTRPWEESRDLIQKAAEHAPRSLWVLREASAHARAAGDDETLLEMDRELAARMPRPLDTATLSLRAAEAAARLGRSDEAVVLLGKTLEVVPDHLVARELRARLTETKDVRRAAQDLEALARACRVPAHRFEAWYRASGLWLDRAEDLDRGLGALEQAAAIDVTRKDVFDRLQLLYVQRGDRAKLAHLLEQRLAATTDPDERIALEVTRGRALFDVGDRQAARQALGAALEANPDHADALEAYAQLSAREKDWQGAEESWIRLARVAQDPERQADIYGKLAGLYDTDMPNPARSEICHREILKRRPGEKRATRALIGVYVRLGETAKAVQMQTELVEHAATNEEKRDETLALAHVHEDAKDKKGAFAVLEKARKTWPHDRAVFRALCEHHKLHGETATQNVLIERASAEARRALSHGRFETAFFGILETAAEVRGQVDAAAIVGATLAAIEGRPEVPIQGAGAAAAGAALDDLVAPELLSPALRALLAKLPGVLDAAYPVDTKALRAAPLPMGADDVAAEMRLVAESFGVRNLDVLVSPVVGSTILAASAAPARIIVGQALLESEDHAARYFCFVRALRMLKSQGAAFARMAPIEIWPAAAALLTLLAPGFEPQGVDASKLGEARRKLEAALPARRDEDLATLALEVSGAIGNRASQLGHAVAQWGARTALLAVGSPAVALRGVAFSLGESAGPPADIAERLKWVQRHPEARDLAVFGASEAYAEARRRAGLAT